MDIGAISLRYAKALLAFAQETNKENEVYAEVKMLNRNLAKYPKLKETLGSPIIARKEKLKVLIIAAVGDKEPTKEFRRFIELVLTHHREVYLQFICMSFMNLYYRLKNIAVGTLTTAVPVNEEVWSKIKQTAASALHSGMRLQTIIDPAIEGGFIFDVNDYRLDASVANQLKRVKQQFIEKNKRIV